MFLSPPLGCLILLALGGGYLHAALCGLLLLLLVLLGQSRASTAAALCDCACGWLGFLSAARNVQEIVIVLGWGGGGWGVAAVAEHSRNRPTNSYHNTVRLLSIISGLLTELFVCLCNCWIAWSVYDLLSPRRFRRLVAFEIED